MTQTQPATDNLWHALRDMVTNPIRTLVPPWSWKAAALNALLRGAMFFITNLRAGKHEAVQAMVIESVFAVAATGLLGAISQRLRKSEPLWGTVVVVCFCLPAGLALAQSGVHRIAHTPHVGSGLVASFCFTVITSAYTWYAMRQGILLGGEDQTGLWDDVTRLPRVTSGFFADGWAVIAGSLRHR